LINREGEGEREALDKLQKAFIELKKVNKTTIIQVTQMNRNIESIERINNPALHYPQRNDIFGSDFLYFASDYVMITHRPEILGIKAYGPKRLPADKIYLHIIKNRDGEQGIIAFNNELKYNNIEEI